MMIPQRLSVKFFVKGSQPVDLGPFTPLFHRWIQNETVEGLLVDVADYKHVPDGPGVILIGHEVDYALDLTGARPGLMVRRKRYQGRFRSTAEVLRDALRKAVAAAEAVRADGASGVSFDPGAVEITLIDRLATPNTEEALAKVLRDVEPVLGELFEEGYAVSRGSADPRACLSLTAASKQPVGFESLLDRLEAKTVSA